MIYVASVCSSLLLNFIKTPLVADIESLHRDVRALIRELHVASRTISQGVLTRRQVADADASLAVMIAVILGTDSDEARFPSYAAPVAMQAPLPAQQPASNAVRGAAVPASKRLFCSFAWCFVQYYTS